MSLHNTTITTKNMNADIDELSNVAQNASNPIPNTLAPSVSITGKRKASIEISDSATKKQTIESANIEKHQTQAMETSTATKKQQTEAAEIEKNKEQYICPCGAGCSDFDNEEDICANGCCIFCGGNDFESSGARFEYYTNNTVTSYMIEYVGDECEDVCPDCDYYTHGKNNDCLAELCMYDEYSTKDEDAKEQLRKHCLGDGEVWAAPYRLFWLTDKGEWEEDLIVEQRIAAESPGHWD